MKLVGDSARTRADEEGASEQSFLTPYSEHAPRGVSAIFLHPSLTPTATTAQVVNF